MYEQSDLAAPAVRAARSKPARQEPSLPWPLPLERVKRAIVASPSGAAALVVDLARVRENARRFAAAVPARPHYAVKANPDLQVLRALAGQGAGFEIASPAELDLLLSIGVPPAEIFYSNPIRASEAIRYAADKGVEWFVFDCIPELEKFAAIKPDAKLYLRIETSNLGSDWPLTGKFGAGKDDIAPIIREARRLGLDIAGVTFHVGSQCRNPENWRIAMRAARDVFAQLEAGGMRPRLLDLGGGFPVRMTDTVPDIAAIGRIIEQELAQFGRPVQVIAEPGRFLVADAGCLVTHVIGTAVRNGRRWMHLDAGIFGGLFETSSLPYPLHSDRDGSLAPWTIAGPTCDSVDVCMRDQMLPEDIVAGDTLYVCAAGAYTTAYASRFNGFDLPRVIVIDSGAG